jgi:hypothetical protein
MLFGRALASRPRVVALGVVPFPAGLLVVARAADTLELRGAIIIGLGLDVIAVSGRTNGAQYARHVPG